MPEMWDPHSETFTKIGNMAVRHTYHSVTLLLKDGRVIAGGGSLCGDCDVNHSDIEILTPSYLLNEDGTEKTRPVIREAQSEVGVGATFDVMMDSAAEHTFSIVRTGAATHAINNDVRRVTLHAVNKGNGRFVLSVPEQASIALPGNYYLFAMDSDGVPSIAETVSVKLP